MPAAIVPAIGAAGSVASMVGGKNAQKQAQNAANTAAAGENQLIGAETGSLDKIMQNFFGSGGAAAGMNSLMKFLGGQVGQAYSNPNATAAGNVAGGLSNFTNPNMQAAQGTAGALGSFQGLKPQETNALQTTLGNAGNSTVNTLMSRLGSTSNPQALAQTLLNQNSENALNSTVQLGSFGAQQELGALQSAGSLQEGLSGQQLSGAQSAGGLYSGLSQQNLQNQGQVLGGLDALFGQQSSLLGSALSGTQGLAGLYGQAGQNAASNAASYGNPFASGLSGIANSGLFGGGSASQPSQASYYSDPANQLPNSSFGPGPTGQTKLF